MNAIRVQGFLQKQKKKTDYGMQKKNRNRVHIKFDLSS